MGRVKKDFPVGDLRLQQKWKNVEKFALGTNAAEMGGENRWPAPEFYAYSGKEWPGTGGDHIMEGHRPCLESYIFSHGNQEQGNNSEHKSDSDHMCRWDCGAGFALEVGKGTYKKQDWGDCGSSDDRKSVPKLDQWQWRKQRRKVKTIFHRYNPQTLLCARDSNGPWDT